MHEIAPTGLACREAFVATRRRVWDFRSFIVIVSLRPSPAWSGLGSTEARAARRSEYVTPWTR